MELNWVTRFCCILVLLAAAWLVDYAIAARPPATPEPGRELREMPVPDAKRGSGAGQTKEVTP